MRDPNAGQFVLASSLGRLQTTVAGHHHVRLINDESADEPELANVGGQQLNLICWVPSGIARIRSNVLGPDVLDQRGVDSPAKIGLDCPRLRACAIIRGGGVLLLTRTPLGRRRARQDASLRLAGQSRSTGGSFGTVGGSFPRRRPLLPRTHGLFTAWFGRRFPTTTLLAVL